MTLITPIANNTSTSIGSIRVPELHSPNSESTNLSTDSYQPGDNRGTDRLLVNYRRLAQEQGRGPIYSEGTGHRNEEAALPTDWKVEPHGPYHTEIRNNVYDDPAFVVPKPTQQPNEGQRDKARPVSNEKPNFGPLRPAGPLRTGKVSGSSAYSREIPTETSQDFYPPNHPAMRRELENNTTKAAVYAAKSEDFRYEWLDRKVNGEWSYKNEDLTNFNKGACGAQLHLSEKALLSDGYQEGRGYGDHELSDRAQRMIRKGYAYGSKGR